MNTEPPTNPNFRRPPKEAFPDEEAKTAPGRAPARAPATERAEYDFSRDPRRDPE